MDTLGLKTPHMGWSDVTVEQESAVLQAEQGLRYYFLHSYHVRCESPDDVLASSVFGAPFTCAVRRGNIYGVQFHPEKSHRFGMSVFRRFADL